MKRRQTPASSEAGKTVLASQVAANRLFVATLLATSCLCAISPFQQAHAQAVGATAADASVEEVVVTARRQAENIQDVPQTDIPVTGEALHNANILNFRDLADVVPGIQLSEASDGTLTSFSMRGLTYSPIAQTASSVAFYLNDTPSSSLNIFETLYDVGQIEVLEGPQGTTRGVPSPSGAFTITTRKPDLNEYGGYIDATASTTQTLNANGAVNIPLIEGVLAMRVAGVVASDEVDGVRSYDSNVRPHSRSNSERVSLLYQPNDQFSASVMYQDLRQDRADFSQVIGPGYAGATISGNLAQPPAVLAPNYSGPAISLDQRRALDALPLTNTQVFQSLTWNAQYHFTDNTSLVYEGSYSHDDNITNAPQDGGGYFPGIDWYSNQVYKGETWTQELRFQNRLTDYLDSTLGFFFQHNTRLPVTNGIVSAGNLPNNPANFDPATDVTTLNEVGNGPTTQMSPYAGVDLHLDGTEISASTRYIINRQSSTTEIPKYGLAVKDKLHNYVWIYNASISHKFTDDVMAYFTTGTSWRPNISIADEFTVPTNNLEHNPYLDSVLAPQPEHSTSYEVGAKTTWFDKRLMVDVSAFHQTFTNLGISPLSFYYLAHTYTFLAPPDGLQVVSGGPGSFSTTANAVVQGIEIQAAAQLTDHWNFQASADYSHGHVTGTALPCNPPGFVPGGAQPPISAFTSTGTDVYLCSSNQSIAAVPDWSITLQTEYDIPVTSDLTSYVRAIGNIYAKNPYVDQVYAAPSYGLLNLFAGVRANDGSWQAMVFAKNITNTRIATYESLSQQVGAGSSASAMYGPSGYYAAGMTPRQEFGINVTYALGSH